MIRVVGFVMVIVRVENKRISLAKGRRMNLIFSLLYSSRLRDHALSETDKKNYNSILNSGLCLLLNKWYSR